MLSWTKKDVWNFILKHDIPYNPLHDQGYPSIGCWPCTQAVGDGEDERAGRWAGTRQERMRPARHRSAGRRRYLNVCLAAIPQARLRSIVRLELNR